MQRWVLHIDMDAFYASCEQLTRPTLRNRPVLVGGISGRGVVAGASYEARKFGAHSAMPMSQARALVGFPAVVVRPRRPVYKAASQRVFQIIEAKAGVVEQISIDEGFMEPTSLVGATAEEVTTWAQELRSDIKEQTGLPASVGAGSGKQFAKIGSGRAKPDGIFITPVSQQHELLGPLPVSDLWGVGPVTHKKLRAIGVKTIADLAALSLKEVEFSLGRVIGPGLWNLARGVDDREVQPRAEAKQISAERTFAQDLALVSDVDKALNQVIEQTHRRLLIDGRAARTVSVKLKMSDFHIETRSSTRAYATDDFDILKATAFNLVRYPDEVGAIRLIGVSFSGFELSRQHVLLPELDQHIKPILPADTDYESGMHSTEKAAGATSFFAEDSLAHGWQPTQDVFHPDFGHGWIQGTGHGVVSVRFETRTTGVGKTKTFAVTDNQLLAADPLDSLEWPEWLANNVLGE